MTDLTNYDEANYCHGVFVDLIGTEMIYVYSFGNHFIIPTINTTGYENLIIEFLNREAVYAPEYEGYCILNDTKTSHIGPDNFDLQQQVILQENYLFMQVKETNDQSAIQIVNVTDFANPTCLTRYKHGFDTIYDYAIFENIMILAINDTENIRLVDITNKNVPLDLLITYSIPYTYSCSLEVKDNLLFVYDDSSIYVFDLSDAPNLDLLYKIETIDLDDIVRIVFYNDYLISIHHQQISIYDLTAPSNETITEFTFEYEGLHNFYFGLVDNNRLYTSMFNEYYSYTLAIYDLTEITNPVMLYPHKITTPVPIAIPTILSSIVLTSVVIYYQKKRK
jgi:hypothetical protein